MSNLQPTDTCATCRWVRQDERPQYALHGFCERFPPQLVALLYDGITASVEQHRPWMSADDRCGEYIFSGRRALAAITKAKGRT